MRNYALATKAFSLGQEIRYIRKQEIRARNSARYHRSKQEEPEANFYSAGRYSLEQHRLNLSRMARATHLARAYIDGTPYRRVENSVNGLPVHYNPTLIEAIVKNVARYKINPFGVPAGYPNVVFTPGLEESVKNWLRGVDTREEV